MAAERLHGEDTTGPLLAKSQTETTRLWIYVRDDRPVGGRRLRGVAQIAPPGRLCALDEAACAALAPGGDVAPSAE